MSDELDPTLPVEPAEAAVPTGAAVTEPALSAEPAMPAGAGMSAEAAMPAGAAMPAQPANMDDAALASSAIETAAAPTPEEIAALVAAAEAAIPIGHVATPEETAEAQASAEAAAQHKRRHFGVGVLLIRFASFVMTLLLLAGGAAIGAALFQRTLPPPILVGDVSTGGVDAPPVVKELTDALTTNNADSIRSAVSTGPYEKLAAELQQWNIKGVTSVETLATMKDGPRSATEIIIRAKTSDGNPLIINLVVHVADNKIVNFR